jgi:hypothetical protein
MTTASLRTLIASAAIVTVTANFAFAQAGADRAIEQYSCKDIMRDGGGSRDVAIAFLHGYLLGKSGTSKFNLATLEKQTDTFIEYCLDHPAEKAEAAMAQAKK